jgi:predicted RNase H-like HicB family nuclease
MAGAKNRITINRYITRDDGICGFDDSPSCLPKYPPEKTPPTADIPDLKYCSAFGETPESALQELQIAKTAWLEAATTAGKPIPEPKYRPAIYQLTT